jgi:Xaa-Pro aminopeptidase
MAEGAARSAGAEAIIFTVFGSGSRTNTIVGRPTERVIRDGDIIMAALAVQYHGYVSTAEFPFVAGKASAAQKDFLSALMEATCIALDYMKPGKPMLELVRAVKSYFRSRNLHPYDVYPPMHGIGLAEAEDPYPDENSTRIFAPGMTVNTDISLFGVPGIGGNRVEESFVFTENGVESLTPLIRQLCEKGV